MSRRKKPVESVAGSYTPIPHAVLDSTAFAGASHRAKALLFELLRQHTGRNNGHFQLTTTWLKTRGWRSADAIQKGKNELLQRKLIAKTRFGGLTVGPDWYALTWLPITDYAGLDIKVGTYHPGEWQFLDAPPPMKKRGGSSGPRNGAIPPHGIGEAPAVPAHGTIEADFHRLPIPPHGNNECCQFQGVETAGRVVGKRGRSGVKKPPVMQAALRTGKVGV